MPLIYTESGAMTWALVIYLNIAVWVQASEGGQEPVLWHVLDKAVNYVVITVKVDRNLRNYVIT